ncbi:hypothetical protein PCASD_19268 [Puccinia coronata f. sp. avenae]|uniref:Uncharacterized protein n=1 Tax=Puccinia coronata f. sp. avenae TaxID=200324 RepID=A0A2N5SD89_9BASI|nr:hypothetical protein PCASD_19268 [Puccinia coronata f. sp. avenae]
MVATSLRLLAIIVLFQLGWALATATAAQSTQTDILFTHDFPSTSIIRTKWQGTCSFILAKIPRFQRQSDSERLWIAADSSYRHWSIPHCLGKSTSGKFRPRESPESAAFEPTSPTLTRPLADSPSGAVILLAADAPAKGVTPGNRFRRSQSIKDTLPLPASQRPSSINGSQSSSVQHSSKNASKTVIIVRPPSSANPRRSSSVPVAHSAIPDGSGY